MGFGFQFGYGFQQLIDARMRWLVVSGPVYYRRRKFDPETSRATDAARLGFGVTLAGGAGTEDILIDPPASYQMLSVHNIGMSAGKLRFGARQFLVSATWVSAQACEQGLSDPSEVWRSNRTVGLVTDNLLFSIEDVTHADLGQVLGWMLTCNANELR